MSIISSRMRRIAGAAVAAVACAGSVSVTPAQAAPNPNAGYLVVYNNNIENMLPTDCVDYDFNKLLAYLKAQATSPDIFTVQQISDQTQLKALTDRLSKDLGVSYAGVIAVPDPVELSHDEDVRCENLKAKQTNAVIYRTGRFTKGAEVRWRSDAPDKQDTDNDCRNLDKNNFSKKYSGKNQDRVENVAVRLTDKVAKKNVTVASFHWPTSGPWEGPYCAEENIREAQDRTASLGAADLTILGGDANTRVDKEGSGDWWQDAADAHFYDVVGKVCAADCPDSADTFDGRRIDFIFVKGGPGSTGATTISTSATGGAYSEHLALRANVKY